MMEDNRLKKYILFDLDGTLTDPKIGICTCVQYSLESFGIIEPDIDQLEPFIGPPLIDSFKEFYGFSDEKAKEAAAKYRERFNEIGWKENKVYPGIKHMLKALKKNGFHLAVASSKPQVFVERIMNHFGIAKYFEVLVGSNIDGTRTDKKEIIDEVFRQLFKGKKVEKDLIYMVGDRKFDIIGAQKQGVECVAVSYGYGDIEELLDAHADYIVRSVKELESFLLRQTNEDLEGKISRPKGAAPDPITLRSMLSIIISFIAFIGVREIAEISLTILFSEAMQVLPKAIVRYLMYGNEMNANSFIYEGNVGTIITGLSYICGALVLVPFAKKLIKRTSRDTYILHPFDPAVWQIALGIVMTVALVFSTQIIVSLTGIAQKSDAYVEVAQSQYSCSLEVGFIVYVLISPICEEVLFRGIIFTTFRRYLNVPLAIGISSLLFAIYHGTIVQGVYAMLMGCLMAWMYEYFGNFFASVAVHAIANMLAYLMSYFMVKNTIIFSWPFAVFSLVIGIVSVVVIILTKKGIIDKK